MQVVKEKKFSEDISDNGTATTDCEARYETLLYNDVMYIAILHKTEQSSCSDTHSDSRLGARNPGLAAAAHTAEFHSLTVTTEQVRAGEAGAGPCSLPHFSNFEDFAERRRRRESFV